MASISNGYSLKEKKPTPQYSLCQDGTSAFRQKTCKNGTELLGPFLILRCSFERRKASHAHVFFGDARVVAKPTPSMESHDCPLLRDE
jgi:hypothetical protein